MLFLVLAWLVLSLAAALKEEGHFSVGILSFVDLANVTFLCLFSLMLGPISTVLGLFGPFCSLSVFVCCALCNWIRLIFGIY